MKLFPKLISLVVVLSLALGACASPTPTPTIPTTTPKPSATLDPTETLEPTATSAPTETPGPTDEVWQRILKNNKIVVGVSLDSPPFSEFGPLYKMDGLDVALANEIGNRLNIPVEIQSYAPEGLSGALQLNQIDLALAGIPNSADDGGLLSFSNVYLTDDTSLLVRKLAPIPAITDFTRLARFRIGVESGSVFEKLARNYLVDSGLMPKARLTSYAYLDQAVLALSASQVDVVILGRAAAGYYSLAQPDLHVVGTGFAEQDLSAAMRASLPGLKARIDWALGSIQSDGTLDSLTNKYVRGVSFSDVPAAQPVSQLALTPSPAATTDPGACVDGLQFISDETNGATDTADPPKVKTEKIYTQTWKVRNTGTCTWTSQYHLLLEYVNVDAAQMKGVPVRITSNVNPGEVNNLAVELYVPAEAGVYQAFWQLENDRGQLFGQALWAGARAVKGKNLTGNSPPSQPKLKTCQVINTGPAKDPRIRDNFDVKWDVTNTSGFQWNADAVTYVYVSGDKFQKQDSYSIPADIPNGETQTFAVDMDAPTTPGQYSTVWNVVWGKTVLCTLVANFTVIPR